MPKTLAALDEFFARILTISTSSKMWATAAGMILAAWIGFSQGGWEGAAIAIAGVLGLPTVYTISKTYQNTHGQNHPSVLQAVQMAANVPAPSTPMSTSTSSSASPTTAPAPSEQPVARTPFDKEAFMAEVERRVVGNYGVRNACTLYYQARTVLAHDWVLDNPQAAHDAWEFMFYLVGNAFKEVWGESYDDALLHLTDEKTGCTYPNLKFKAMQLGVGYYAILLEYENVKRILDSVQIE